VLLCLQLRKPRCTKLQACNRAIYPPSAGRVQQAHLPLVHFAGAWRVVAILRTLNPESSLCSLSDTIKSRWLLRNRAPGRRSGPRRMRPARTLGRKTLYPM